jgi:hypothetical protein
MPMRLALLQTTGLFYYSTCRGQIAHSISGGMDSPPSDDWAQGHILCGARDQDIILAAVPYKPVRRCMLQEGV